MEASQAYCQPDLYGRTPDDAEVVTGNNNPPIDLDNIRKTLAEDRTGELVIKVPGMGYVALSQLYRVQPVTEQAPASPKFEVEDSFDQLKLI